MCDTLVVTSTAAANGVTLFAKNSDREPNEAHCLLLAPAADHAAGNRLRCTYIEIEQVPHTYGLSGRRGCRCPDCANAVADAFDEVG